MPIAQLKIIKNEEILSLRTNNDGNKSTSKEELDYLIKKEFTNFLTKNCAESNAESKNFKFKLVHKNRLQSSRRLRLNTLLASLDLESLAKTANRHPFCHPQLTESSSFFAALNLFTTSPNQRKMIENEMASNSRIKNIQNNLFHINKAKLHSQQSNLKLNQLHFEKTNVELKSKKKRPPSQEGIIEECKNSLNELIKASKWTETSMSNCDKEEKLGEIPLGPLSLSIAGGDPMNQSCTSSSSSLGCVANLSNFFETKPEHNCNQVKINAEITSKPPLNKSILPKSYKNIQCIFSPQVIANPLMSKSTSCNSSLCQKSNFSKIEKAEARYSNSKNQLLLHEKTDSVLLAQSENVDFEESENENKKAEQSPEKVEGSAFRSSNGVQFRNVKYTHLSSDYKNKLHGIKNLSMNNLSQTDGIFIFYFVRINSLRDPVEFYYYMRSILKN